MLINHSTYWISVNVEAALDRQRRGLRARVSQGGFTLIELMMVVGIIGVLASIAIPTFMQYQTRARQSEARTSLGAIYMGEHAYWIETGRYGSIGEIRYVIAGRTRYTYRTGAAGAGGGANANVTAPGDTQDTINASTGTIEAEGAIVAGSSATSFTATAAGNLDADPTVDRWSVNELRQGVTIAESNDIAS